MATGVATTFGQARCLGSAGYERRGLSAAGSARGGGAVRAPVSGRGFWLALADWDRCRRGDSIWAHTFGQVPCTSAVLDAIAHIWTGIICERTPAGEASPPPGPSAVASWSSYRRAAHICGAHIWTGTMSERPPAGEAPPPSGPSAVASWGRYRRASHIWTGTLCCVHIWTGTLCGVGAIWRGRG